MDYVMGKIILAHPWSESRSTGEISMIGNRTVLHASNYKNIEHNAYRTGVRDVN
jgi:hypothetical protein